jgi:hypothetical protein
MGVRGSGSEATAPAGTRLLRTTLLVAGKDLRQRLRDRSALVIAFIAPFVLAAIIGLAFGGDAAFRATYAVADADRGPVAAGFTDGVLASPGLRDLITVRKSTPARPGPWSTGARSTPPSCSRSACRRRSPKAGRRR